MERGNQRMMLPLTVAAKLGRISPSTLFNDHSKHGNKATVAALSKGLFPFAIR
jgi:hypothetical protein